MLRSAWVGIDVSVCPSGLRGYVQVVMFSNAWVQIPQLTFSTAAHAFARHHHGAAARCRSDTRTSVGTTLRLTFCTAALTPYLVSGVSVCLSTLSTDARIGAPLSCRLRVIPAELST